MVASEERYVLNNNATPTNPASLLHNKRPVQTTEDWGPTHYNVLLSRIDGVDTKEKSPVLGVENINMLDPPPVTVQEVATHLLTPSLPQQLFKLSANVPPRPVYMQPSMDPMLVVPDPSPPARASNIAASDDELLLAYLQSMQSKHASLALKTTLYQDLKAQPLSVDCRMFLKKY